MGRVKLFLKNPNGLNVKSMAYVVQGGKESLLGQRDSVALGINNMDLQGHKPGGQGSVMIMSEVSGSVELRIELT